MSSSTWEDTLVLTEGLFSLDSNKNAWYNANEVFVMYCSSDVWSGNGTSHFSDPSVQQWQFKGKQIIATLIDILWDSYALDTATQVSSYDIIIET